MRCEIIAVGTELLLGQINDTNSAWMGQQLALAGIDSYYQTKVGDNIGRIVESIELALSRSDAVITCGGLGPTQDDLTREAICQVMGVGFVRRPEIVERIRAMFAARGRDMAPNNLRQADVPEGAEIITQQPGTAPGLICPVADKVIYAVPGIPSEMQEMVLGTILGDLQRRAGVSAVIRSRVLRTWGTSESALAEMIASQVDALEAAGNPTLAFQASGIEGLKVRITAKAGEETEALAMIAEQERQLRAVLGDLVFGVDDENMEAAVLTQLRARGLTLAVAESLTGGMVGSRLTAVAGASDVFRGAVVSYASDLKFELLGVTPGPVVCERAAREMAAGVCRLLHADVGISTTGVAGPSEQDGQPVGTVFVGLSLGGRVDMTRLQLTGARNRIREFSVIGALDFLRLALLNAS